MPKVRHDQDARQKRQSHLQKRAQDCSARPRRSKLYVKRLIRTLSGHTQYLYFCVFPVSALLVSSAAALEKASPASNGLPQFQAFTRYCERIADKTVTLSLYPYPCIHPYDLAQIGGVVLSGIIFRLQGQ
jgi:hypothetical protein